MPGMGLPPNPHSRRRNAKVAMVQLPADGRKGPPPLWPLDEPMHGAEERLWAEVWALPQAAAWERMHYLRSVARYVRLVARDEESAKPDVRVLPEIRQMEDRLGLNPLAMLRLRWEVTTDEIAEHRSETPLPRAARLRAVDPGALASG